MPQQLRQPLAEVRGRSLRPVPACPMRFARLRTRRARMARNKGDPLERNAATLEPVRDRAERASRLARALVDDDVMRFAREQLALKLARNRDPARERLAVWPQRHRRRSVKRRRDHSAKRRSNAADPDDTRHGAEAEAA